MNKHTVSAGLGALTLAATLALAGCGGNDDTGGAGGMDHGSPSPTSSSSASVSSTFNDADVHFVQMMLPHHEQAVAMSDTLLAKSGVDPDVTTLAQQIKAAQQPEIDTMKSWLTAWGEDAGSMGGMDGMGMGNGMATDAELKELEAAGGADAQQMYLKMMTAHHTGAIAMANAEITDGSNADAVRLAKDIVTTQQREITVMKDLLQRL